MAYIGPAPKLGQNREVDDISSGFNGSTTAFTLQVGGSNASPGSANNIIVSVNNVVLNPNTAYTINGSTITFTSAPTNGHAFFGLILGQGIDSGEVSNGSVSTAKLADNAVTLAKMAGGTDGQIITYDASGDPVAVGPGTDGQVLTSTGAGSPPAFEALPASTTINNNADNRIITGSGTANTLEGEANLTYNGTRLLVNTGDLAVIGTEGGDAQLRLTADEGDDGADYWRLESKASDNNFNLATYSSGSWVDKISVRSDGEVHIGTIESGNDRGAAAIKAVNDHAGSPINVYFQEASGGEGYGVGVDSDGDLNFHNSGSTTPTLEIKDDNNVAITNGNLIIGTSGKGIDFSATSDVSGTGTSMDNELFKDYEEGSWTPKIKKYSSGSWVDATMTTAGSLSDCYYVKIGDICHFHIGWSGFEVSDSSYCVIGGLPFASAGRGQCVVTYTTAFNNHQNQGGHIGSGGDQQIQFYYNGNSWNAFNNNTNGLYIYADGWYKVA